MDKTVDSRFIRGSRHGVFRRVFDKLSAVEPSRAHAMPRATDRHHLVLDAVE